jgi:Ni,Fe-hydrogenase maturation factor
MSIKKRVKESSTKKKTKTIFCFGNPLVKEDCLPLMIIDDLQKEFPRIEFMAACAAEDAESVARKEKELTIIDTVKGIKKVSILSDEDLLSCAGCSLHDFDIGASIRLMKKLGMIRKATIFGIPAGYSKKKAILELKDLIRSAV